MNKKPQDYRPKTKPMVHQIEAIDYICRHPYTALFDEQGLGKTKVVIDALSVLMENGEVEGALIIAPLSLVFTWEHEIEKHSNLFAIVLRGSKREKRYKLLTGANFYIANYEEINTDFDRIKRLCKSMKLAIVLDEAARIKNPDSVTSQTIFALAPYATRKIIITGTPVANKPFDIWAQFYFLDQGHLLGEDFHKFKNELNETKDDYQEKLKELKQIITQNSIRRLKQDALELPEKIYINKYVDLSGIQFEMYDRLRDQLRLEVMNYNGDIIIDEADNILKKLLRLIQIACNPGLLDKAFDEIPAKLPVLCNLIEESIHNNEKVIVWSTFVENIIFLKNRLRQYNPLILYGNIPIKDRAHIVNLFQNIEKHQVLIANPSAAREGLTLTRANVAIYYDRNFNLVDYLQSQDRIHRISQQKQCKIFKLIALNTIDEYVDLILEMKTDVAKYLEGDLYSISNTSLDTLLNKREILRMLGG